ncbi:3-hydroxyacyl-CoA dehydrogenase family protein [Chloroflexota bacterium]
MKVNDVKRIGIVGSGVVGTTLAAATAQKYEVVVKRRDISKGLAEEAKSKIKRCFPSMVKREKLKEEQIDLAISHISITDNYQDLKNCQVIFDASPDILEVKIAAFAELDKVCPPETIFFCTSACVSVTSLAADSGRPDRTMTAHFMTPVHIWNSVEVAPAIQTSQETIAFAEAFLKEGMDKTIVRCKDTPGLIQDYFLFAYFNHAIEALQNGAGTVDAIDTMIKEGFGLRLGPFELMDHLGMGGQVGSTKGIYNQLYDKKFAPPPLLVKMVDAGYIGRIAGKGWYLWDEQGKKIGINQLPW